ncbi:hypothetical protein ACET3Z_000695 [Daucus carota]
MALQEKFVKGEIEDILGEVSWTRSPNTIQLINHLVVIGSYIPGYQQEPKPKKQRSKFAPTISPVPAPNHAYAGSTDSIYNIAMQSITPPSYHGINGNAANSVSGPSILAAESNISSIRVQINNNSRTSLFSRRSKSVHCNK